MSLKAKLEAVIYAAEEPVTLAQLALLFTADALEWKAEQEAAAALAAEAKSPRPLKTRNLTTCWPGTLHPGSLSRLQGRLKSPEPKPFWSRARRRKLPAAPEDAEGENSVLDVEADESAEPVSDSEAETAQTDEAAAEASLKRESTAARPRGEGHSAATARRVD